MSIFSGQVKIAVTGTPVQLPPNALAYGQIIIQADLSNSGPVYVGPAAVTNTGGGSGNGFVLKQDRSCATKASDTSAVWINGNAGDWISFIAS